MLDVVAFGNCQAHAIVALLRKGLPKSGFRVDFLSNNERTGGMKRPEEVLRRISSADVVLFQPLGKKHQAVSAPNVRAAAGGTNVTFPYLFNSGISSLCYNSAGAERRARAEPRKPLPIPQDTRPMYGNRLAQHSYGNIWGEEAIFKLLVEGATKEDILAAYHQSSIDFETRQRFDWCLDELRRREVRIDIQVAEYISDHFRDERQFLTHNHPATSLLVEIIAQFTTLTDLPVEVDRLREIEDENAAGLRYMGVRGGRRRCPVTPRDAQELGYRFGHDEDWFEIGSTLISLICDEYESETLRRAITTAR